MDKGLGIDITPSPLLGQGYYQAKLWRKAVPDISYTAHGRSPKSALWAVLIEAIIMSKPL